MKKITKEKRSQKKKRKKGQEEKDNTKRRGKSQLNPCSRHNLNIVRCLWKDNPVRSSVQAKNCIVAGTFTASYDYYTRKLPVYYPSPQCVCTKNA